MPMSAAIHRARDRMLPVRLPRTALSFTRSAAVQNVVFYPAALSLRTMSWLMLTCSSAASMARRRWRDVFSLLLHVSDRHADELFETHGAIL